MQLDFVVSVITSIIGGIILGYMVGLHNHINLLFSFGSTKKIWFPFLNEDTAVIITGRQGELPRSTIKNSYSELIGAIVLRDFFMHFNRSFTIYNSKINSLNVYNSENIILLGSQNANPGTKDISEKIAMPFSYDGYGNLIIRGNTYSSKPTDGSPLIEDYALIVKCVNPYNEENRVMILAGNHGCATEAAVKYVTSKTGIAKIGNKLKSSDFLAVIKVKIENNIPKSIDLVGCWKFEEVSH